MSAYTRSLTIPAAPGAQDVTLPGAGLTTMASLEVTKVPDGGDLWFRCDGVPAAIDDPDSEFLPSGNPSGAFHVGTTRVRNAQRANGDDWVVSVVYAAGGLVHFRS